MQMAWGVGGHIVGHNLRFDHDAVNAFCRIVKQLDSPFDGGLSDIVFTAIEQKVEEQREHHCDDEHNQQSQTEGEPLLDISDNLFHLAAVKAWSNNNVIVSVASRTSICFFVNSAFDKVLYSAQML